MGPETMSNVAAMVDVSQRDLIGSSLTVRGHQSAVLNVCSKRCLNQATFPPPRAQSRNANDSSGTAFVATNSQSVFAPHDRTA